MKVISLVDNCGSSSFIGTEHGLSLYIETSKARILFDMGKSDLFAQNAKQQGIDLEKVDFAVLSHGHYDHGGGMEHFLEINRKAPVYASSHAFGEHYHGKMKYIGIDQRLRYSNRVHFAESNLEIEDGIMLYPFLPERKYNIDDCGLTRKTETGFEKEDFRHEQYLSIRENGKHFLFSGCSHRGIFNIAEAFQPDVLIGGFHFFNYPLDEALDEKAILLDRLSIEYYTCHCTGWEQYCRMREKMKHLHYLGAGESIEL